MELFEEFGLDTDPMVILTIMNERHTYYLHADTEDNDDA